MKGRDGHVVILRPRDPVIARDARPFSAEPGARARTLDWPLPQTIAGALRTHIGNALGFDWHGEGPARARTIRVQGPLLVARSDARAAWQVYLPAPRDAFVVEGGGLLPLRPMADLPAGAGCDLPLTGLRPLAITEDAKAAMAAPFWSLDDTVAWLASTDGIAAPARTLGALPRDTRVHVRIDPTRQTSDAGFLFSTTGLVFADAPVSARHAEAGSSSIVPEMAILCRVTGAPATWQPAMSVLALGGERRLAVLETSAPDEVIWPPVRGREAVEGSTRLRLQLVTPALFGRGWLLDGDPREPFDPVTLTGVLPGLADTGPRLRLVGAAIGRRQAISGWSLNGRPPGPKATRYAVPAGSVFFFEVVGAPLTSADGERLWLRSICGRQSDQLDGYGLVAPGRW